VLPGSFSDPPVGRIAELLGQRSGELAESLASLLPEDAASAGRPSAEMIGRVLNEVARSFANFRLVATREAELQGELSAAHEVTATVPYHPGHVTDLKGLLEVGARIWGDEAATTPPPARTSPRRRSNRRRPGTSTGDDAPEPPSRGASS